MKGNFAFYFIVFLMLGATIFVASFFFPPKKIRVGPAALTHSFNQENFREKPEKDKITLFLVGDIMLDRGVEYYVKKEGGGDWKFPFLKIAKDLQKADILFGNLESPISDKGQRVGSRYSFRADPRAVEGLKYAGFDILSLANNHALDYTREALEQTMDILREQGIDYVGAGLNRKEAFSAKILEVKDTKIAFLAFTNLGSKSWAASEKKSGLAWINRAEEAFEFIREAKEKADLVVVALHGGDEYSLEPNNFQKTFAQISLKAGADLVVGHHPHVVQPIERSPEGWVAYSLGNFIFDQSFSEETMKGLLLEVEVEKKKIKKVIPHEIKIDQFFQPALFRENSQ